jgi:hypothetical protein
MINEPSLVAWVKAEMRELRKIKDKDDPEVFHAEEDRIMLRLIDRIANNENQAAQACAEFMALYDKDAVRWYA